MTAADKAVRQNRKLQILNGTGDVVPRLIVEFNIYRHAVVFIRVLIIQTVFNP